MKALGIHERVFSSRCRNFSNAISLSASSIILNNARRRFHLERRKSINEESNPADNPDFISVVDQPNRIVSTRQKHGPGLIILGTLHGCSKVHS